MTASSADPVSGQVTPTGGRSMTGEGAGETEGVSLVPGAALRSAARKMRQRANSAMTGDGDSLSARWFSEQDLGTRYEVIAEDEGSIIASRLDRAAAVHIARWDPFMALSVADWLDYCATRADNTSRVRLEVDDEERAWYVPALRIANTYLGNI